jgi:G3E family GTPase
VTATSTPQLDAPARHDVVTGGTAPEGSPVAAPASASKLPVTIITGFLGSGKTTVLNHLVKQPGMQATAVVINEFGEVGIDHLLVETSTELMVELNNGCICCTIRGDLADKLGSLAMWLDVGRIPPVERVVVETTGLADPAPIMHTLMAEPDLLARYRLDRLITVVDAIGGSSSLDRFPEAAKQIAVADLLLVSKTDLIDAHSDRSAYAAFKARVRALNPRASMREVVDGAIDPASLLGSPGDAAEALLSELEAEHAAGGAHAHVHHGAPAHDHALRDAGIASFVLELERPVDGERFNAFLQRLAADHGRQLLRMKGIFRVEGAPGRAAVVHGVQHVFFPVTWLERWPAGLARSQFVFITQHLPAEAIAARFREQFS